MERWSTEWLVASSSSNQSKLSCSHEVMICSFFFFLNALSDESNNLGRSGVFSDPFLCLLVAAKQYICAQPQTVYVQSKGQYEHPGVNVFRVPVVRYGGRLSLHKHLAL